jgi:glycosyltransferase involved in cell wall biosynthesis
MKISVIIPVYNEEKHIKECLRSLLAQDDYPEFEIIVVDDGSTDKTREILQEFAARQQIIFLKQNHLGSGHARNLGASLAGGEILVLVDADMSFTEGFLRDLVKPIIDGKSKGTFSKEEYVANWDKKLARFWQYNRGIFENRMIPKDYPAHAPIFRAILKSEFQKVHGYDTEIGYTDDWTLSRKSGYESDVAENAKYYHYNPDTLREVFWQARWIGKNEFIAGNLFRKIKSLLQYNFISSFVKGIIISIRILDPNYIVFQFVYDSGICISIMSSFFINKKIK